MLSRKARGRIVLLCLALAILVPAFAEACAPDVATSDDGIRLIEADGIERVKMEIAYLSGEERAGLPGSTRYLVISAAVPADGHLRQGLPRAGKLLGAEVLEASGPACE